MLNCLTEVAELTAKPHIMDLLCLQLEWIEDSARLREEGF